jgi:hypothetical protein
LNSSAFHLLMGDELFLVISELSQTLKSFMQIRPLKGAIEKTALSKHNHAKHPF